MRTRRSQMLGSKDLVFTVETSTSLRMYCPLVHRLLEKGWRARAIYDFYHVAHVLLSSTDGIVYPLVHVNHLSVL